MFHGLYITDLNITLVLRGRWCILTPFYQCWNWCLNRLGNLTITPLVEKEGSVWFLPGKKTGSEVRSSCLSWFGLRSTNKEVIGFSPEHCPRKTLKRKFSHPIKDCQLRRENRMRTFLEREKPEKGKHEVPSPQYARLKYKEKSTKTAFHPEELDQSKKKWV